ncbi:MAG: hypothetical protein RJA36_163 [Pseudomonadota bacterium]|jgi:hypothetical protein
MLLDIIKKGSADRSVLLRIIDSTDGTPETGVAYNTSGIDLWYRREGAAKTSITEASLAALTTAHTDGGFLAVSDGYYRLDSPDAAFATGANYVDFGGTVTGMIVIGGRVRLVDFDLEDSVRAGLTALPNAAAAANGGLPTVDANNSVKVQARLKSGQAFNYLHFAMTDTTGAPLTGLTCTVQRVIDNGSFASGTLASITEIGNGLYRLNAGTGDHTGNNVTYYVTASGAAPTLLTLTLEP